MGTSEGNTGWKNPHKSGKVKVTRTEVGTGAGCLGPISALVGRKTQHSHTKTHSNQT